IHWYQQKANKTPERMVFYGSGAKVVDDGFQAYRYTVENFSQQKLCILTMNKIVPDDTATYYCAYWHSHSHNCSIIAKTSFTVIGYYHKVFGSGTKLIVSEKGNSPPASTEILQKKHKNLITYVCLIEKFYPEVIRVTWTDGEKEVTENVVKGDTWKPTDGDKYSVGSWLTVPAENKDKTYHCRYEHESEQKSLQTKGMHSIRLFCLTLVTDHILHRTAYLVYIVLLLKSSMYYLIVLFFIYR
ncbi:IGL1 protein, partial [Geococcyx californianus]|nr:IGL1 protein [Geococcyx californianus]